MRHLQKLVQNDPRLRETQSKIERAFQIIVNSYEGGGKLLLCGNGGSACDCEHIAGELMKGFLLKRPLPGPEKQALCALGAEGELLADSLQRALPALVLSGLPGLATAFGNDVDPRLTFAQQAFAYAAPGDVLLALSTSGNADNVRFAALAARSRGAVAIGLTGKGGGKLRACCDLLVDVPQTETYLVQELHLAVYHCLCMMLEEHFYGRDEPR
jgi:D-sedoheptulose 7-phosphate isomerase